MEVMVERYKGWLAKKEKSNDWIEQEKKGYNK